VLLKISLGFSILLERKGTTLLPPKESSRDSAELGTTVKALLGHRSEVENIERNIGQVGLQDRVLSHPYRSLHGSGPDVIAIYLNCGLLISY